MKPLGKKSYGSIPHLLGSKLGEGEHHCHEGQHRIATEKTRDKHDLVIVQVKYDGSNVAVAKVAGQIIALTRKGYTADSSPFQQHHVFSIWVAENEVRFSKILNEGDRVCGEWLFQAHGLKYEIQDEPFVAFDLFRNEKRLCYGDFIQVVEQADFTTPRPIGIGHCAFQIAEMIGRSMNQTLEFIRSTEAPEGLIYRVERQGEVDFLAKYVRPDFVPGRYLPEISGSPAVFNFEFPWINTDHPNFDFKIKKTCIG